MASEPVGGDAGVRTTQDLAAAEAEYRRLGIEYEQVTHPVDGHVLRNPHTLEPVVQVRPDGAYEREKQAARRKVDVLVAHLEGARAALAEAEKLDPAARWDEIVADLVEKDAQIDGGG